MPRYEFQPIGFDEACAFINQFHRHHIAPLGWKFGIAANDGRRIVAVATVGRPVSRVLDDGFTMEMTRLCVLPDAKNAGSRLIGCVSRILGPDGMGYRRAISYILDSETGVTYRAAGWRPVYKVRGRTWSVPSRPRVDKHPTDDKYLWEAPWSTDTKKLIRIGVEVPRRDDGQLPLFEA